MSGTAQRIMLVEDDDDIATIATMAFRDLGGFDVVHFSSGAEALKAVAVIRPDIIVLDFSMPGMNGDEVLQELKSLPETSGIPVIFMTASVMPSHVAKLKELGAIDVFKKPFDPMKLSDQVRNAVAKHST